MNNQQRAHSYVPASLYNRSERIVIADDGYFYKTREGEVLGPFHTESKALFDLNIFLNILEIEKELKQGKFNIAA